MSMPRWIKSIGAALAGAVTFLWGEGDIWLYALIACVAMDYLSGVMVAIIKGTLTSEVGFKGICKKVLIFLAVAVAHVFDNAAGLNGALRSVVIGFFVANEGISILENAGRAGIPIPKKLLAKLAQLKENNDE